jgi:hypothetical protein
MAPPKVYADFQNLDDENRLRLTCAGTLRDLERQGIRLHEGLVLTLYSDDANDEGNPDELRAEGRAQFNHREGCWVAVVDWSALRHASAEAAGDANGAAPGGASSPAARRTTEGS